MVVGSIVVACMRGPKYTRGGTNLTLGDMYLSLYLYTSHGPLCAVQSVLANFDAEGAECYLMEDRERLLAVVEAGFDLALAFFALVFPVVAFRVMRSKCRAKDKAVAVAGPRQAVKKGPYYS